MNKKEGTYRAAWPYVAALQIQGMFCSPNRTPMRANLFQSRCEWVKGEFSAIYWEGQPAPPSSRFNQDIEMSHSHRSGPKACFAAQSKPPCAKSAPTRAP